MTRTIRKRIEHELIDRGFRYKLAEPDFLDEMESTVRSLLIERTRRYDLGGASVHFADCFADGLAVVCLLRNRKAGSA